MSYRLCILLFVVALAVQRLASADPYTDALAEMSDAMRARDYPGALRALDRAEEMVPPNARTLTARGAIALQRRKWEEATKLLTSATKMDPKYYPARFNMAECLFMQLKYAGSRELFQKLLEDNPRDELVQFRIFLDYLLEKDDATARAQIARMKYPGETPAFYYANAAWEFAHGNQEEGNAWVTRGNWAFTSPAKTANFAAALVQLGWIKRPESARH